ncbi:MAG: hypothetical protein EA425_14485 [Puniceicoccaceae bacterium]|nr:MAG: hypothetical protein EA425_14485 [Puniceicoccaceae bacterium]
MHPRLFRNLLAMGLACICLPVLPKAHSDVSMRWLPEELDLPRPALVLISGAAPEFFQAGGSAGAKVLQAEAMPFEEAVRVKVPHPTDPVWGATLTSPRSETPIATGDVLLGSFWIRGCAETESGSGQVTAYLQRPEPSWHGLQNLAINQGAHWQRRFFRAVADRDFDAGTVNLVFHLGSLAQTVDIGGLMVWNLGPGIDPASLPSTRIDYAPMHLDPAWLARMQERIDRHRMGEVRLTVRNAAGEPLADAAVQVELVRHAFGFGTFIEGPSPVLESGLDAERFRETVLRYFNRVTSAVYPADWGWQSEATRAAYLAALKWATEHGLDIRAHTVIWPSWQWSPSAWRPLADDPPALQSQVLAQIEEVLAALKPFRIDQVDLVNEPRVNNDFETILGRDAIAEWFAAAAEIHSGPVLAVNEYGILSAGAILTANHDHYAGFVQDLLDRGAPLGAIGFQCHLDENPSPPGQVEAVLDRFATLGLPLQITELTLKTTDEQYQADYLRDFLTVVFAHPAVASITFWGFWEGRIWLEDSALWRRDWSPKPAAEVLDHLLTEEWTTRLSLRTGEDGTARFRGFHGRYRIAVGEDQDAIAFERNLAPPGTEWILELD